MKPADLATRLRGAARGDTMLSLLDQVIVSGTRFATTVMVGRFGSESELGYYSLAFSVFVLLVSFQESLISVPYTVFVSRLSAGDQRSYAANSLVQSIGLNAIAMSFLAIVCVMLQWLQRTGPMIGVTWMLAAMLPLLLLREFARRFAFAHLKVGVAMALDSVVSLLQLAGLAALVFGLEMTATNAYLVSGVAAGVGSVAWLVISRSSFHWDRTRFRIDQRKNWAFGKWVAGAQLTSVSHMYFAHWLLAATIDERATGIYAACMTVVVLANPFILGMSNVLSPKAAHAFSEGGADAASRIIWRFTVVISAILTVFAVATGLFGNRLIVFIFDEQYSGHGATIWVLASGTIALGASYSIASGLRAINRPAANLWASISGLLVTVVVSSVLVQSMSILGTTIGLVAGFIVMTLYRIFAFRAAIGELRAA